MTRRVLFGLAAIFLLHSGLIVSAKSEEEQTVKPWSQERKIWFEESAHEWKGQFEDLPEDVIEKAGGLNRVGNHASFVATSPFGLNFNDPAIAGGVTGCGPIWSQKTFHDRPRLLVIGYDYSRFFEQHGRSYTIGREGTISRAPVDDPTTEEYEPWYGDGVEKGHNNWETNRKLPPNRLTQVQDWFKGTGVVMGPELHLANHPNNSHGEGPEKGWVNHPTINRISADHFEIFVPYKSDHKGNFRDLYRVVLDAGDEDWSRWHLEHDEDGVIFDIVIHASQVKNLAPSTGARGGRTSIGDPSYFVDNKGTDKERRFLLFSYGSGGEGDLGIAELVPKEDE